MTTSERTLLTKEQSVEFLKVLTREVRDLLDNLAGRTEDNGIQFTHPSIADLSADERSQIVQEHFAMDNSGYGIPIEEWLTDISEEERIQIVTETLDLPEYKD